MKLKNKVALVTGGSRGIGRTIVSDFIKEGARVIFLYKKNSESAKNLIKDLGSKSKKAIALKVDVLDYQKLAKSINKIIRKFKKIDIVDNNAGIISDAALLINMPKKDWDKVIDTNLTGVFNVTKLVIPALIRQRKGSIINMTSVGVFKPLVGISNYITSKAGIIGFTRAVALEVARYGITVNAVAPGCIETDMLKKGIPYKITEDFKRSIPIGRVGNPEEVAKLITFLVSDDARYITGAIFPIDGGICVK